MNDNARWETAQYHEVFFWKRWKNSVGLEIKSEEKIEKLMFDNYNRFMSIPHGHELTFFEDKNIADVGCGPNPTIAFRGLQAKKSYCIDPLIDEYKQILNYNHLGIDYIQSIAEKMSLGNDTIDVLLCLNAIDHMSEPVKALLEFRRVLSKHGELYLQIVFDEGDEACHPHSLGLDDIVKMLEYAGLYIWQSDIRCTMSGSLRPRSATFVCRKYSKSDYLRGKQICLYGAGGAGEAFLKDLKKSVPDEMIKCFCDSDKKKWDTYKDGKIVLSIDSVKEEILQENIVVFIVSTVGSKEIAEMLKSEGLKEGIHYFDGLLTFS